MGLSEEREWSSTDTSPVHSGGTMLITSASYSPFTSVETRRFIEQELQRDLERERRRRERRLEEQRREEAAADRDKGGTME